MNRIYPNFEVISVYLPMSMLFFSLQEFIYAACYGNSIIILDVDKDKYISLIGSAATYLTMICTCAFVCENNMYRVESCEQDYDVQQLNHWIEEFLSKEFIQQASSARKRSIAPAPLKEGGLSDYRWDSKPLWQPFARAPKWEVIKAFFQLVKVHRCIAKEGMKGLLKSIKHKQPTSPYTPTPLEIERLAAAVDAASTLYPKKTLCLAWSATFVLLALKRQWKCDFVIGIQTTPFYAHAWAECQGKVVNDQPMITQVLSMILREPY
jgi:hypothetical protein